MYDILVIGGGPAGITAGIYGVRAGKKVVVLEANEVGGKILQAHMVDNYPGVEHITGKELGKMFYEQALNLGVEIKNEKAMNIMDSGDKKIVQTLDNMYEAKTVIIATGNDKRELGVPGEKELLGRGVSYCATCDGNFFRGKDVVIVGGGEESVDDALYLANLCNKVYFVYNRKMDISKLNKDNIEILENTKVKSINGENKVEKVVVLDNDDKERELEVSGIFIAIANIPETSYLLNGISVNENGNVIASEDLTTGKVGIFVAGDLREKSLRQVATAVSDGAVAATNAVRYLNELKSENAFEIFINKKNMISETNITVNKSKVIYKTIVKVPGSSDEEITEKVFDDKEVIEDLIKTVYESNKDKLVEIYEKVKEIPEEEIVRQKNTAVNNLFIKDKDLKLEFDCYIQQYESIPSLFTVEIEKYVSNLK